MATQQREKRIKNYKLMRSVMDYGMGLVIFSLGVFLMISDRIGFEFNIEPFFRYLFAGMCVVYGSWRIYRGYQQNYVQHDDNEEERKF